MISKHILGETLLDSPEKLLAADVDASGSINTVDLVELRKAILHINDSFPNNTSWRFQPEEQNVSLDDANGNAAGIDFTGVKIGDVNQNANPNA